jgi:Rad3-related DNA helicase
MQSRESLGIPLEGNVVLIDEAHNLIEAINAAHTYRVSLPQVRQTGGLHLPTHLGPPDRVLVG